MPQELKHILQSIDALLDSYELGELDPDRTILFFILVGKTKDETQS